MEDKMRSEAEATRDRSRRTANTGLLTWIAKLFMVETTPGKDSLSVLSSYPQLQYMVFHFLALIAFTAASRLLCNFTL